MALDVFFFLLTAGDAQGRESYSVPEIGLNKCHMSYFFTRFLLI